ncbi:GNAT family N-acetyltransferase [Raoultella terrigena]|uniref:GNAT family N-acetyltransferase n=1 Tax=Raoultella terrigena TaxID=577 RepID=UPI00349FB21D
MKYTESPRLIIRSFQDNDAEDMFEYLSNPRVACFMDQKLHSLEEAVSEYAYVADYNEPSQNLCRHLGMRLEGCFKEHVSFITDNETVVYENTLVFAVLAKEWRDK